MRGRGWTGIPCSESQALDRWVCAEPNPGAGNQQGDTLHHFLSKQDCDYTEVGVIGHQLDVIRATEHSLLDLSDLENRSDQVAQRVVPIATLQLQVACL